MIVDRYLQIFDIPAGRLVEMVWQIRCDVQHVANVVALQRSGVCTVARISQKQAGQNFHRRFSRCRMMRATAAAAVHRVVGAIATATAVSMLSTATAAVAAANVGRFAVGRFAAAAAARRIRVRRRNAQRSICSKNMDKYCVVIVTT